MRYPKTKHGFVAPAQRKSHSLHPVFKPTWGLHSGDVPQDLPPGFTPAAQNFVVDQDALTPRSGLSRFGGYSFGRPVLGAAELQDASGAWSAFASSASTLAFYHSSNDSWNELSYKSGSVVTVNDLPSASSTDYWSVVQVHDPALESYIAVTSNGSNFVKWFEIESGTTQYSDFTWIYEVDQTKTAKAVSAIADRIVLFNSISSAGTKFPTRVIWSARGLPKDFTRANGAGFEDLVDMRGEGQTAIRMFDLLVLFTDQEVWVAQPTLDDYAFRFQKLSDSIGCPYPRTAVQTPRGVMFLGRDLEVYVVGQGGVEPISRMPDGTSRIARFLGDEFVNGDRAWAIYNAIHRRYELYFSARDSTSGFPTRALFYAFDRESWLPQKFNHELSAGCDLRDPGTLVTFNDLNVTWDSVTQAWDSLTAGENRRDTLVFGSGGTSYRMLSTHTNDDGTTIDARWRSHGLNQRDHMRQKALSEVWLDFTTTSDSSLSLYVSTDLGRSFDAGKNVNLLATGKNAFVPVWGTGQSPMFEVRIGNGSQPRIERFQATLVDAGKFRGA